MPARPVCAVASVLGTVSNLVNHAQAKIIAKERGFLQAVAYRAIASAHSIVFDRSMEPARCFVS